MKKIALTGNMGCGKSYVLNCIKNSGVPILDMDEVAKQVRVEKQENILSMFHVSDSNALADIIFNDKEARTKLESFMYPYMIEKMFTFFEYHKNAKLCVVEVPLLFEKNWDIYFDEYWVIACDEQIALSRVLQYRHIDKQEVLRRWKNQMPIEEKIKRAHRVIHNNGDCEEEVRKIIKEEQNA